jgi:hypothetical protein
VCDERKKEWMNEWICFVDYANVRFLFIQRMRKKQTKLVGWFPPSLKLPFSSQIICMAAAVNYWLIMKLATLLVLLPLQLFVVICGSHNIIQFIRYNSKVFSSHWYLFQFLIRVYFCLGRLFRVFAFNV